MWERKISPEMGKDFRNYLLDIEDSMYSCKQAQAIRLPSSLMKASCADENANG